MDADSIGAPGVQADAEMCMMMADTMEALGVERGEYVVRVNNRKVLDGILEAIGLGGEEHAARRLDVMRAIDKLDRLGLDGVHQLLGAGRKDESGDFTKGVGLDEPQIVTITGIFGIAENENAIGGGDDIFSRLTPFLKTSQLTAQGYDELQQISQITTECGYGERIKIDPSIVRGLEYYTGLVYEVELTFPVTNEKGQEVVFGSVGGGGRYDGLVKRFTGQPVPATGFSIGVSRLLAALKNLGKLDDDDALAPVLMTVMDGNQMGNYQHMVQELREAGIRAEMYQGNWKKFGNQLKYADRRDCPMAIIQGEDERSAGEVQIKDLIEGKRLSQEIEDNITWRETRPAQVSVKRDELVETVSKILEAQKADRAKGALS